MAIVPIVNDISILDIREIINLKAAILGITYNTGTIFAQYNVDTNRGKIRLRLLNTDLVLYSVTIIVTGPIEQTTIVNIQPSSTYDYSLSNLPAGNYNIKMVLPDLRQDNSDIIIGNGNITSTNVSVGNNYPVTDVSVAKDIASTTSNYLRSDGINIVNSLPPTPSNADLSDWRGAQVYNAIYSTLGSSTTRYGADRYTGYIRFVLYSEGFSSGPVSINIGSVTITKPVGGGASGEPFNFNNLSSGNRECSITDLTTGNIFTYIISLNTSSSVGVGVINGTDIITGFTN